MIKPRTGQAPSPLGRDESHLQFRRFFLGPAFLEIENALSKIEQVACVNYVDGYKVPITEKAGTGFADSDHDLSVKWLASSKHLAELDASQKNPLTPLRVLINCGSARDGGGCPGGVPKTWRPTGTAQEILQAQRVEMDVPSLSLSTSDHNKHIHPCKAYAWTAMPLCHWPCSCYPDHGQQQTNDWHLAVQEEVRNVARAVALVVKELRQGTLSQPNKGLEKPLPKQKDFLPCYPAFWKNLDNRIPGYKLQCRVFSLPFRFTSTCKNTELTH